MRNCKAFSLAIIQHGSAHAPMLGQDAPLSQVNGGGQVPLALPVLVTAQRTHAGQSMAARFAPRLSRPLTGAACFAFFRDEFIGDDALIFLCGAISVAATNIV